MKQIPKAIKILGMTYPVTIHDTHNEVEDNDTGRVAWGLTNWKKQEIRLYRCALGEMWNTLIHEVIHIVARYMVIEMDEDTTERAATGITSFMVDNGFLEVKK